MFLLSFPTWMRFTSNTIFCLPLLELTTFPEENFISWAGVSNNSDGCCLLTLWFGLEQKLTAQGLHCHLLILAFGFPLPQYLNTAGTCVEKKHFSFCWCYRASSRELYASGMEKIKLEATELLFVQSRMCVHRTGGSSWDFSNPGLWFTAKP